MQRWIEVPIFIHGVNLGTDRVIGEGSFYSELKHGLDRAAGESLFDWPGQAIEINWGWNTGEPQQSLDRHLADVEHMVCNLAEEDCNNHSDPTWNPLRPLAYMQIRRAFLTGFADMFYCVSGEGEAIVRDTVFGTICRRLLAILADPENRDAGVSLTFFTHSAGSVIAHDLLYHLFGPRSRRRTVDMSRGVTELRTLSLGIGRTRVRVRVRKFFTLGSPLTPLVYRAGDALGRLAVRRVDESIPHEDKARIFEPSDIGLNRSYEQSLRSPRWINFYDKDDVIAFPVEMFYKKLDGEAMVVDHYVKLGSWFPDVHNNYWSSPQVAEEMVTSLRN